MSRYELCDKDGNPLFLKADYTATTWDLGANPSKTATAVHITDDATPSEAFTALVESGTVVIVQITTEEETR